MAAPLVKLIKVQSGSIAALETEIQTFLTASVTDTTIINITISSVGTFFVAVITYKSA